MRRCCVSVPCGPLCDVSFRTSVLHPRCAKAVTSAEACEDDGWIARRSSPHDVLELLHLHDRVRKTLNVVQTGHSPRLSPSLSLSLHNVQVITCVCDLLLMLHAGTAFHFLVSPTSALPKLCISPFTHAGPSLVAAAEARPGGFGVGVRPHTS